MHDDRSRRGSNAIELALILPFLLLILTGTLDLSWMFYTHQSLSSAARMAVRDGSVTTLDDGPGVVAEVAMLEHLADAGVDPSTVSVAHSWTGAPPDLYLTLDVTVPYQPLIGFVPSPDHLTVHQTMRMENQQSVTFGFGSETP